MTNKKISALTSATMPLAGTETLPIVQSGAIVKSTVANIVGAGTSPGSFTTLNTSTADGSVNTFLVGGTNAVRVVSAAGSIQVAATNAAGNAYAQLNLDGSTVVLANAGTAIFRTNSTDSTFVTGNLIQGTAAKGVNFTANTPAAGMTSQLLNWYEEGTWTPTDASGAGLSFTVSGTATYIRIGKLVTVQVFLTFPTTVNTNSILIGGLPFTSAASTYSEAGVFTNSGLTFNAYLGASISSFDFRNNTNTNLTNANLSTKFAVITLTYRSA